MTTATTATPAKRDQNASLYESLAIKGDLSGLNPKEKATYYSALCERLGLDPATQPFLPLRLNGKEILYATKGATDQLARIHNVNRQVVAECEMRDVYIVTVEATLPNGRKEQSKGAVTIGKLMGDAFCNAIMKAETKAKRRATLSILGLGMLDESELDTIPEYARRPTKAELVAGSIATEATDEAIEELSGAVTISELCKQLVEAGDDVKWNAEELRQFAEQFFDLEIPDLGEITPEMRAALNEELTQRLEIVKAEQAA